MPLPTQKTKPKTRPEDFPLLIYGPPKIGKSTFCSQADDPLFLATERGLDAIDCFQQPIGSWPDLLKALGEIAEGKHSFKTIIIDTIDNAYRLCSDHICSEHGAKHESDLSYGKGWALVNNEFQRVLMKLGNLPYGIFLVSHSQTKEIDTRTGKLIKTVPTLPDKASKIVVGFVSIMLYAEMEETIDEDGKPTLRRVMRTDASQYYEAGDRTGRLAATLPLDYTEFKKCFLAKGGTQK